MHQPFRLKNYDAKEIDVCHSYHDTEADEAAIRYISDHCYLPANEILLQLVKETGGRFRISFSLSGTVIELLRVYRPDVIRSFRELVDTGNVEILGETYYHSLSSLHSLPEFIRQAQQHRRLIQDLFGVQPVIFRNTELIYNDRLGECVAGMGFTGLLCEGVDRILHGRSPNRVYAAAGESALPLLLRNARLSDDIAFRFDERDWPEHPLTTEKFAGWLHAHPADTEVINLFMDYETFGLHKKAGSGIFDFLRALPEAVMSRPGFDFALPSEVLRREHRPERYEVTQTISWQDQPETSCVWSGNMKQHNTLKKIYSLEKMVMESGSACSAATWGRLQSADHFYYMSEENGKYRNPFPSAEAAYHHYRNILADFEISLIKKGIDAQRKRPSPRPPSFTLY